MIATCHCQHCSGPIEFEAEGWTYGEQKTCPNCCNETKTYLPVRRARGFGPRPTDNSDLKLLLIYLGAVFLPIAGFFGGIYLMVTKKPGHGATAMALSVMMGLVWFVILSNL